MLHPYTRNPDDSQIPKMVILEQHYAMVAMLCPIWYLYCQEMIERLYKWLSRKCDIQMSCAMAAFHYHFLVQTILAMQQSVFLQCILDRLYVGEGFHHKLVLNEERVLLKEKFQSMYAFQVLFAYHIAAIYNIMNWNHQLSFSHHFVKKFKGLQKKDKIWLLLWKNSKKNVDSKNQCLSYTYIISATDVLFIIKGGQLSGAPLE